MKIERLDRLVLAVRDVDLTCEFYARVLGMEAIVFDEVTECTTSWSAEAQSTCSWARDSIMIFIDFREK
ncbi:MAG TPA: VOC family protein [Allocoleopsis sp.]